MSPVRQVLVLAGSAVVRRGGEHGPVELPVSMADDYLGLARRLGELLEVPASVIDGPVPQELPTGTVVLCRVDGLAQFDRPCAGRPAIVLLGARRAGVLRLMSENDLAAAVESDPFTDWTTGRPRDRPAMYGRLDVAARLHAQLDDESLLQDGRNGRFQLAGADDVPAMLAVYLREYADG
jgi:hypothetical protein